jgi:hypothetical protein
VSPSPLISFIFFPCFFFSYHVEDGGERAADVVKGHADKLEAQVIERDHADKDDAERKHLPRNLQTVSWEQTQQQQQQKKNQRARKSQVRKMETLVRQNRLEFRKGLHGGVDIAHGASHEAKDHCHNALEPRHKDRRVHLQTKDKRERRKEIEIISILACFFCFISRLFAS